MLRFISETFFHQRVRGFASHKCTFHFDSVYDGQETLYGSNKVKINKEGSLDVSVT